MSSDLFSLNENCFKQPSSTLCPANYKSANDSITSAGVSKLLRLPLVSSVICGGSTKQLPNKKEIDQHGGRVVSQQTLLDQVFSIVVFVLYVSFCVWYVLRCKFVLKL